MSCPILSCAMPASPDLSYYYSFCLCCSHISLLSICLTVSSPLSLSSSFYLSSSFRSRSGRGLTFTSARVLVSSTCRQSRHAYRHKGLHFACSPCSRAHCVLSPMGWAVSACSHMQQNIDMANYRMATCTQRRRPGQTASHSAPTSVLWPFRIGLLFAPCSLGCSVSQLFPACVPFSCCCPLC